MADDALRHMGITIDPNRASAVGTPRKTVPRQDLTQAGKRRAWRRALGGSFGDYKFSEEIGRGNV